MQPPKQSACQVFFSPESSVFEKKSEKPSPVIQIESIGIDNFGRSFFAALVRWRQDGKTLPICGCRSPRSSLVEGGRRIY
jgi:hypothetical protein